LAKLKLGTLGILDTNALSAMADGGPALESVLRLARAVALPVIALGEFCYGVQRSCGRVKYERWIEILMQRCRVLDVDERTTEHYAAVRSELKSAGQPIPGNGVWIGSTRLSVPKPVQDAPMASGAGSLPVRSRAFA
jgi:predicted nucleic acid-binding protein